MKKFLPYLFVLLCLAGGVGYFLYAYSPSTLEKKESDFSVRNIDDVTRVRLTDEKTDVVDLTKKGKKWTLNGKYEVNEEALGLLFTAIQKMETLYPAPAAAEPVIQKDMTAQYDKCEIYLNNSDKPYKVFYVGGPTADGLGTYMIMERDGKMAKHYYVTHIPGLRAYLTARFFPDEDHWRGIWVYRDNDEDIQSLKVWYDREKQKSFEIDRVSRDSFVIANGDGIVAEQPKQKFIHQYLEFYNGLSVESYENKYSAKDTILPTVPYCTINMKRTDSSQTNVVIYYMPADESSRVIYDDNGRKLLYDIEHFYMSMNEKKDFTSIQYYSWGKIFRSYDEFFKKPGEKAKTPS